MAKSNIIFYEIDPEDGSTRETGLTAAQVPLEAMIANLEGSGITERVNGEGPGWEICTSYKDTLRVYMLPPEAPEEPEQEEAGVEDPEPAQEQQEPPSATSTDLVVTP